MLKKLMVIFLLVTCFFLFFQWDVKQGYKKYTKAHPYTETTSYTGQLTMFPEGSKLYTSLFTDMKEAESYIYLQFFIFRDDPISMKFIELLKEKAKRGVDVKFSVDRFGGKDISSSLIKEMQESGIEFAFSRPLQFPHLFYSLNHRNHRKLVAIDGHTSYIGGFNIGEEYLGNNEKLGYWRDYHLRIQGNGTYEIEKQFLKDWEEDTGDAKSPNPLNRTVSSKNQSAYQLVFATGETLENQVLDLIKQAKHELIIATPYFIPSDTIMDAFKNAKKRGVTITLIVPDHTDAWFTKPPSYPKIEELFNDGAAVYLYTKGFFHGKVMIIDDKVASVSTANWDPRSFYLNDEASCLVYDQHFIEQVKKELKQDMKDSRKITREIIEDIPIWEKSLVNTPEWIYYYF
ncbi:cardiolipin synthase [Bacillus sp. 1780r2a1]|uniref:cardiolipin synthase n=1 Tax=Priestia flexa TaxID=86664 RepID=UPI0022036C4F|nr:cardiolipin synthase [Priestia flexa]MDT2046740.1 cardiolipin synthase [Priestia flexa]USY53263.1 cardiolipin synthase [Bacillus sp. 1780r2a1]